MRARYIAVALGAAAFMAARPAAAQNAFASNARPVVTYQVASHRPGSALPARVVLADSNGTLVASYWVAGERNARPMTVVIDGTDILLGADTSQGALQLVLYGENDRTSVRSVRNVSGRWSLGGEQGAIRGRGKGA